MYSEHSPDESQLNQEPGLTIYGSDTKVHSHDKIRKDESRSSLGVENSYKTSYSQGDEQVVEYVLEPLEHPESVGLVNMVFSFSISDEFCQSSRCCDEVPVKVATTNGLQFNGEKQWVAYPSQDKERFFSTNLQITIPPEDTSSLRLELQFGPGKVPAVVYFVTTGELVEFWKGYPSSEYWKYPKIGPDTIKYEVKVDLRDRRRYETIERFADSVGQ